MAVLGNSFGMVAEVDVEKMSEKAVQVMRQMGGTEWAVFWQLGHRIKQSQSTADESGCQRWAGAMLRSPEERIATSGLSSATCTIDLIPYSMPGGIITAGRLRLVPEGCFPDGQE